METTKKITMATVKSFIKKHRSNLFIKVESNFDGMTDMVEYRSGAQFRPTTEDPSLHSNSLGINGAWFVGQSRDYLKSFENDQFVGIDVYNSCGSFILATPKS